MKPFIFFAYLDPGSGSLIIQMVIGAVAAGLFTMKAYWKKIFSKFSRKRGKTDPEQKL